MEDLFVLVLPPCYQIGIPTGRRCVGLFNPGRKAPRGPRETIARKVFAYANAHVRPASRDSSAHPHHNWPRQPLDKMLEKLFQTKCFHTFLLIGLLACSLGAPTPSSGCGSSPPVRPGSRGLQKISVADSTQFFGRTTRQYWLNMPKVYDSRTPSTLAIVFHGFYDIALDEQYEDSIPTYVNKNSKNVISVYPAGSADGGDSAGWNVEGGGLNTRDGPYGPICTTPRRGNQVYKCYKSCSRSAAGCDPRNGCDASSCMDDRGFIKSLVAHLTATLCIDLEHVHLTGIRYILNRTAPYQSTHTHMLTLC